MKLKTTLAILLIVAPFGAWADELPNVQITADQMIVALKQQRNNANDEAAELRAAVISLQKQLTEARKPPAPTGSGSSTDPLPNK